MGDFKQSPRKERERDLLKDALLPLPWQRMQERKKYRPKKRERVLRPRRAPVKICISAEGVKNEQPANLES